MKRIIALILAVLCLTVMLTACSKKKCELCGEKSSDVKSRTIDGEKADLCKDCYDGLKALSDYFG